VDDIHLLRAIFVNRSSAMGGRLNEHAM